MQEFYPGDVVKIIEVPGLGDTTWELKGLQTQNWIVERYSDVSRGPWEEIHCVDLVGLPYIFRAKHLELVKRK